MRLFLLFTSLLLTISAGFICTGQISSVAPLTLIPDKKIVDCKQSKTIISINIIGNRKTKTKVIIRETNLNPGNVVCIDTLANLLQLNYQRLYNLNMFTDIQLSTKDTGDNGINIYIQLKEQWFIIPQADIQLADRNINVWWNEQNRDLSRINLGVYFAHKNLSGRLDRLTLSTHIGYTQQISATYTRPYIDKRQKQGLGFGLGYSRSKELAYATINNKLAFVRHNEDFLYSRFFVSASWFYRAAYHTRHILSMSYNQYQVGDHYAQRQFF